MELKEQHKYQNGFYHVIQLFGGSAIPIYLVIEKSKAYPKFRNYLKSFTRKDEAEAYTNDLMELKF